MSNTQDPLTLSVEETAHLLGISRGLAYTLANRGEIPSIRLGRRLLVPRHALHQLLEQPTTHPEHGPPEEITPLDAAPTEHRTQQRIPGHPPTPPPAGDNSRS